MFGVLGPVGKLIVAKRILDNNKKEEEKVVINNNITNVAVSSISVAPSESRGRLRGDNQSESSSSSGPVRKIQEQKQERSQQIQQMQSAAKVTQYIGAASALFSLVSYGAGWPGAAIEFGAGVLFMAAGRDGEQILINLEDIINNPLHYKQIPSGKWKVDEIGKKLKENTLFSDWVIDKFIIPAKFKN